MRLAYIVSRFPSSTETFIAREMQELRSRGAAIELFALVRQNNVVVHPEAKPFLPHLRTAPLGQAATLKAQWFWIRHRPNAYFSTLWAVILGNWRSPAFLARGLIVFPMAARFAREIQATDVQHVHAHWATHPALAAYVVHRLTDLPFSITAHAHDIYVDRSMLEEKIRSASFVATISSFNRDYLRQLYGDDLAENIFIVRCGVDTERFEPGNESTNPDGLFTLLCVASLQPYKGHAVLLDALAELRRQGVPCRCVLLGDGESRGAIEAQLERLQLREVVELAGACTSDQVLQRMRAADAFVLPSVVLDDGKMEGIPVALMEAMACELPVITSRISGIPELVVDEATGLLVEPGNPAELARAMHRLSTDRELRVKLGAAARKRVVEEFGADRNADRLVALFTSRA